MSASYVMSFDLGTSGIKSLILDTSGKFVSYSVVEYGLHCPKPGWAEQSPAEMWDAVCAASHRAMRAAGASAGDIAGIVFGTYWKGIIPIDAGGNTLYNNIIWLDSRAGEQAQKLNQALGTDTLFAAEYWPKLMWVRENLPEVYEKTEFFLETNAFLKYKATGEICSDFNNNFIHSDNPRLQGMYDAILGAAGLDKAKFPPLVSSTQMVGTVTARAAGEMGLKVGTPVYGGNNDLAAIAIGSGCSPVHQGHLYMGSSGWVGMAVKQDGSRAPYLPFYPGQELMLVGMQSVGMTFDWAAKLFYHEQMQNPRGGGHQFIDKDVLGSPPGSLNLLATPWINGERPPLGKNAKALYFNATNQHNRRHFMSATMEGVCYHMRMMAEKAGQAAGFTMDSVRAVGGCAASAPWMQMMADIFGMPVHVIQNARHAGAIGTAYCALVGMGVCGHFDDARDMIEVEREYLPRAEYSQQYETLYLVWQKLYPALKDLYEALN